MARPQSQIGMPVQLSQIIKFWPLDMELKLITKENESSTSSSKTLTEPYGVMLVTVKSPWIKRETKGVSVVSFSNLGMQLYQVKLHSESLYQVIFMVNPHVYKSIHTNERNKPNLKIYDNNRT